MMPTPGLLWTVGSFLLVIGPLIFIHEMGHYLVGRLCGVHAETFSIGFGRELVGWTDRSGTRWKVSLLPLGGYVKFAGDMNPASVPDAAWLSLPAAERNRTFQAKKVWQKALVVLAGPATNFLFPILVYAILLASYGVPRQPAIVSSVMPGSAAAVAGIRPGDRITMVDRRGVSDASDVIDIVQPRPNETVRLDVYRGARALHLTVTLGAGEKRSAWGDKARMGLLGVDFAAPTTIVRLSPLQVPGAAAKQVVTTVDTIASTLSQMVTGERSASELQGPIGMAGTAGKIAALGWLNFVLFMAAVSINLGFINLLPIPILDGGHLMFYLIEAVKRGPVNRRVQEWSFRVGLAFLATFMIGVTLHDIASLSVWHDIAGLIARG